MSNDNVYLFILWSAAREQWSQILADLKCKFELESTWEVSWSREYVSQNFSRFYGLNLPPGSDKEMHCGSATFLAIILRDPNPVFAEKATSKGKRLVNSKIFEAKEFYRSLTGGGHRVHSTVDQIETRHDLALLFGEPLEIVLEKGTRSGQQGIPFASDIVGSKGWKDIKQLFIVLNETIPYVVLRNFEPLPYEYYADQHGDIDLLSNSLTDLVFITNANKVYPEHFRVAYTVEIGSQNIYFDFRYSGDFYYDEKWENDILANRVFLDSGIYVPSKEDYFNSLLYHAFIHKPEISPDYVKKLVSLGRREDIINPEVAIEILTQFFDQKSYRFTRPVDSSVFFNSALAKDPIYPTSSSGHMLPYLEEQIKQLKLYSAELDRECQRKQDWILNLEEQCKNKDAWIKKLEADILGLQNVIRNKSLA